MTNRTITTDVGREDANQTLEYYQDRLDQAWDTLRRLPIPELCQKMTHWPTMVRQTAEVTALNPKSLRIPLASAKPKDITQMFKHLSALYVYIYFLSLNLYHKISALKPIPNGIHIIWHIKLWINLLFRKRPWIKFFV